MLRQTILSFVLILLGLSLAATTSHSQETPEHNPHYPIPNPIHFEGKIDYELLKIDTPANSWEYMQRGIHRQDDLEDVAGAIEDYREAIKEPSLFTPRLRLGYLLLHDDPEEAIRLFKEVLDIDPERLEVNFLIGEAYKEEGKFEEALAAFEAELALSPITDLSRELTGDEANNAHTHYEMGEIYEKLGKHDKAIASFENYLRATRWHSDVYPWRIPLVEKKIETLRSLSPNARGNRSERDRPVARAPRQRPAS